MSELATRRRELAERCAAERAELADVIGGIRAPLGGPNAPRPVAGRFRLPLIAAGALLGLAVLRPRRILPLAAKALGAWKALRPVLALLRRPGA
ncbi:MAG: hypothetical protein ACLGI6_11790 [Gammaproteobacteria bacterium]